MIFLLKAGNMKYDFLDLCIDELMENETSKGTSIEESRRIIVGKMEIAFELFSLTNMEVFNYHQENFVNNFGEEYIHENNMMYLRYEYEPSLHNICEILSDCYVLKVFYEDLIGCKVKFKFTILNNNKLLVSLDVEWDDVFEKKLPIQLGSVNITKKHLLPENIFLSEYIEGFDCHLHFILFDFAYHGTYYYTNIFSQVVTQVKAFLMSNDDELIDYSIFFNQSKMINEYGINYSKKIQDIFSNPIWKDSKEEMGVLSVEYAERLDFVIKSLIDVAEHKDCPSCHSSRTKFVKYFEHSLYLCLSCDNNFDMIERVIPE